ncbi:TnsA-like heteromeric transposase endonuclease subunit [Micromonospora sp. ALFpr18c]|uniref:TnsA-like heteromeric transposase endonuclease subunit n=1 Tax=unclassified Micromonospora TaxID=2617518 RepID=UPI00124B5C02|nr:TnsA-like heteromeric transposase endonuclease subunit [Micromonospora sp. ALFpr18c]KAB1927086.1 TnsA-like heteromeric transposase endonuclease subunit [Micromonospora sp. ALFpr18c]
MHRTRRIGLPGLDENFEAIYLDDQGVEQRVPWGWLPEVVDVLDRPVRSFPSYRGQRNFPGWYWSATVGRQVGFESWVERDHLVALDFDPSVSGIVSQPFWLLWPGESKTRRHAPDFLVRLDDDAVLVLDSRPLELIEEADREAFGVTDRACALLGWRYAVWDRLDPVLVANQRWLAGYRHPRCFDGQVAAVLLEAFARPRSLMDGAEVAGDPLRTLPVLYHLLWRRELMTDLSLVLSHRTIVQVAPTIDRLALVGERDG